MRLSEPTKRSSSKKEVQRGSKAVHKSPIKKQLRKTKMKWDKKGCKGFDEVTEQGINMFGAMGIQHLNQDCSLLNKYDNDIGIIAKKDSKKSLFGKIITDKSVKDCDVKGIKGIKYYDPTKRLNLYKGSLLYETTEQGKTEYVVVDKDKKELIEKTNKVDKCKCNNKQAVIFDTGKTNIILLDQGEKIENFHSIKEYKELKKLGKKRLAEKTKLPLEFGIDQHIFMVFELQDRAKSKKNI